jgi:polysaccharide export outer membrane protein
MKKTSARLHRIGRTSPGTPRGPAIVIQLLLLASLLLVAAGCSEPKPVFADVSSTGATGATSASVTNTSGRLREGDVVKIAFEGDTNMTTIAKIQLDGQINAPLVGDVKAVGRTLQELQLELMRRYQPLLKVNEITVTMVTSAASVYVSGAVLRPGRIPMDRPLTALDAIMEAGGFDHTRAKPSAVTVLRIENGRQQHFELNLKRMLRGDDPTPFYLKPFDIIHVPEKTFNF